MTYSLSISWHVLPTQVESNPHAYKSYTGTAIEFLESGAMTPSSLVIRIEPLPSRIFKLQGSSRVVAYSSPVYSSPFVYPQVEPVDMVMKAFLSSICTKEEERVDNKRRNHTKLTNFYSSSTGRTTSPNDVIFPVCSLWTVWSFYFGHTFN